MSGRSVTLLAACVAAIAACAGEEEPTPKPGPPDAPAAPSFAGLEEVRNTPDSEATVVLSWRPAEDDHTPAAELHYAIRVWATDPRRGGEGTELSPTDVTEQTVEGACAPCTYRYDPPTTNTVWWFAVEVTDRDSVHAPGAGAGGSGAAGAAQDHSAGADVVLPGARKVDAPAFLPVWSDFNSASVGGKVNLLGSRFLDEPSGEGALKLNGVAVPPESILVWSNQLIELQIPEGATSGPVEVTTLFGTATSPEPLQIQP